MTKVSSNNVNEKNQTFSIGYIQIWHNFWLVTNYYNISMTFWVGIIQCHCKSEHKQVKSNKIKQGRCKSNSIFPFLQSSTQFKQLWKFFSW